MNDFWQTLQVQRWDDHRYYHHSRINQALHFVSAISFLVAYVYLLIDPAVSALIGWLFSMTTRQIGHFFFEPKDYDLVNQASHEHKEAIKIGYNLRRKVVLIAVWAASPLLVVAQPDLWGAVTPADALWPFVHNVGNLWLWVGVGGLVFRVLQLFVLYGLRAGLAWATKILTDPLHDFMLYRSAPLALLRGELIDPMTHVGQGLPQA